MSIDEQKLKKVLKSNQTYKRQLIFLLVVFICITPIIQRLINITPSTRSWSFTQLWYSIRDDYFFNNLMLYLFQGDNWASTASSTWGDMLFSIVLVSIGSVVLVSAGAWLFKFYRNFRHYRILNSSDKLFYSSLVNIKRDALIDEKSKKDTYRTWEIESDGRTYKLGIRGQDVIVAATLGNSLPHILIDSVTNKTLANRFISPDNEFVIDGVMYDYFRVFVAENSYSRVLQILNPLVCDNLIRYGNISDIQIKGNNFVMYMDVKDLLSKIEKGNFLGGINNIVSQFELVAVKVNQGSLKIDKNPGLINKILLSDYGPFAQFLAFVGLIAFLVLVDLSVITFDESNFMALLTVVSVISAIATIRHKQRTLS